LGGEIAMGRYHQLNPEERGRMTEIQDLLIERYVEQKEALDNGRKTHAIEIEFEIKELQREMKKIKGWAKV
jgi:hypothetical protein